MKSLKKILMPAITAGLILAPNLTRGEMVVSTGDPCLLFATGGESTETTQIYADMSVVRQATPEEIAKIKNENNNFKSNQQPIESLENYPLNTLYYKVKKGESFASLEKKFFEKDVGGNVIASWNPEFAEYENGKLKCNLKEGDIVIIKNVNLQYTREKETFEDLAEEFGMSVNTFHTTYPWIGGEQPSQGSVYYRSKETNKEDLKRQLDLIINKQKNIQVGFGGIIMGG